MKIYPKGEWLVCWWPAAFQSLSTATMSFSSKPKKVKPQGTVRELKIVYTVNRHGVDTLKTEEVKNSEAQPAKDPLKEPGRNALSS